MLDHDHRIATIPQPMQNLEQAVVISRMKPNARFVQGISYPNQSHPQLGSQPCSLSLSPTQCPVSAFKREIPQAHLIKVAQSLLKSANRVHDLTTCLVLADAFRYERPSGGSGH